MLDLASLGLPPLPEPLPKPTVDAHTHLDSVHERTGLSPEDSINLARRVGIEWIVQAGDTVADSIFAVDLARTNPSIIACVALHPNEVARHPERFDNDFAEIAELAHAGRHVRAIGETGLDHYRTTTPEGHAHQRTSFENHIRLACDLNLTLVIHDRDAHAEVLDVLDSTPHPERVIMHSFSGDSDFARECARRDFWLSFPGVTTYNANHHLRRALAVTPVDKILVETDAPFLTPVPARGRPNGPYLIPHTVRYIAEQLGKELGETCEQLRENAFTAYGGPWGVPGD